MWQDYVISIVGFLFGFMLIPQLIDIIRNHSILNLYSAGLTAVGLYVLGIVFFTLELWVSVAAEVFVGSVWLLVFIFSLINKNRNKK